MSALTVHKFAEYLVTNSTGFNYSDNLCKIIAAIIIKIFTLSSSLASLHSLTTWTAHPIIVQQNMAQYHSFCLITTV